MRTKLLAVLAVTAAVLVSASGTFVSQPVEAVAPASAVAPLTSIGPLTFAPDGVLFAADPQAAAIHAFELGAKAAAAPAGVKAIDRIDERIAAALGTTAEQIVVTDLAVHPKTRNAYVALMRGQGSDSRPAVIRIDGAGAIDVVSLDGLTQTSVTLPNPPPAGAAANPQRDPRRQAITDMAFENGRLFIAGLSNEEFASKLRSVPYPFTKADAGTSVEIFHGNHGQLETRSPVFAFVPYRINGQPHLVAAYLCTPLVTFPVSNLQTGTKVVGRTIAELGNRNRPIDMVVYRKGGQEYLLMSNTSRGVMKIPTAGFASAPAITEPVKTEKGGIGYETIDALKGIEQLDLLDDGHVVVLARAAGAGLSLATVALP